MVTLGCRRRTRSHDTAERVPGALGEAGMMRAPHGAESEVGATMPKTEEPQGCGAGRVGSGHGMNYSSVLSPSECAEKPILQAFRRLFRPVLWSGAGTGARLLLQSRDMIPASPVTLPSPDDRSRQSFTQGRGALGGNRLTTLLLAPPQTGCCSLRGSLGGARATKSTTSSSSSPEGPPNRCWELDKDGAHLKPIYQNAQLTENELTPGTSQRRLWGAGPQGRHRSSAAANGTSGGLRKRRTSPLGNSKQPVRCFHFIEKNTHLSL
ncbi:hypothetical protein CB1_000243039 [Camelus ferus]|nr:hypothetical protein CB1_000243039 [Camelus ferus]